MRGENIALQWSYFHLITLTKAQQSHNIVACFYSSTDVYPHKYTHVHKALA